MGKEELQLIFTIIALTTLFVFLVISLFLFLQRKKTQMLFDKEKVKSDFEEKLRIAQIEISEQSMKDISKELHDNLGQLLAVASTEVNMLMQKVDSVAKEDLKELSDIIAETLEETRHLSKILNPEVKGYRDLRKSLSIQLERIGRWGAMSTSLEMPERLNLSEVTETFLLRMLQEFMSNTIKHAKATTLNILFQLKGERLRIEAVDNGIGFNIDTNVVTNGMLNLRERAEVIGADFSLYSKPGEGCKMIIELPHKNDKV